MSFSYRFCWCLFFGFHHNYNFVKSKGIKTFSGDTWTIVSIQERLSQFLKESEGWERKTTSVPGIFLLKLPSSKIEPQTKHPLRLCLMLSLCPKYKNKKGKTYN